MIINRMLKFALPAMLLAVSAQAYADGEETGTTEPAVVTLNNNAGTVTWSQFVNVINGTATGYGDITTLPADNSAAQALATAKSNKATAEAALATAKEKQGQAKTAKDEADAAVTAAEEGYKTASGALEGAQTTLSKKQTALESAQNAYIKGYQDKVDGATNSLNSKTASLNTLVGQRDEYKAALANAEQNLTNAENTLRTLNASPYLQKKTETETKTATVGWLETIYHCAIDFEANFKGGKVDSPTIYYKLETSGQGGWGVPASTTLTLSFSVNTPTAEGTWLPVKPSTYYSSILAPAAGTIDMVDVYMGSDYAALNNNNPVLTVGTYTGNKNYILQLAVDAVRILTNNAKYQTTTTTTTVTKDYLYPDEAEKVLADIEATKANITTYKDDIIKYTRLLDGYNSSSEDWVEGATVIIGVKEQITTLQNELTKLNGNAETEGSIAWYQDALDKANEAITDGSVYDPESPNYNKSLKDAKDEVDQAQAKVDGYQKTIDDYNALVEAAKTADENLTAAKKEVTAAEESLETAADAVTAADKNAQKAADDLARENYQTIWLEDNIVSASTGADYAGRIYGKGNTITVSSGALFNDFTGRISNAGINGTFAEDISDGRFTNVAVWTGNAGRVYNDEGTRTNYTSFAELGYNLNDNENFGVDFNTVKIVKAADAPSNVFCLTAYDLPAGVNDVEPVQTQAYVQLKTKNSTEMVTIKNNTVAAYSVPTNRFAKSASDDVEGLNLTNVFYGTNNKCDQVIIEDRENFYCPVTIQATTVNYNRTLKEGYNAVCVPFALSYKTSSDIEAICDYDRPGDLKFWFTKINEENTLEANTPALVIVKANKTVNLSANDVTLAATDKKQIVEVVANENTGWSFGTFKKVNPGQLKGESQANYMYGLHDGKFQAGASTATFPAFRMIIGTKEEVTADGPTNAPALNGIRTMGIGIHDEYGNDITNKIITGVDDVMVDGDASSLTVVGGQGEIVITSDADYGKVAIYTVSGAVAAMADVVTGTTTVNLQKGIYIVMGKKVLVK